MVLSPIGEGSLLVRATPRSGWRTTNSPNASPHDDARTLRRGFRRPDRRLRPEHLAYVVVRLDVRAADQVEAIGHRGKDAVECFLDRLRLSGKIENQRASAHDTHLP